jgi:uncharacterized membrane protein
VIRRWLGPLLFGLALAAVAWQVSLVAAPRLIMAVAVKRLADAGGLNHMLHAPLPTSGRRTIVRPSPDLAYSSCPFDLAGGPVLIEAAPVPAPYWSLSVFDRRTDVVFVRNSREAKGGPIRIILARPAQQVPAGIETVRLKGDRGTALVRILVPDRARFDPLDRARRASFCNPVGDSLLTAPVPQAEKGAGR